MELTEEKYMLSCFGTQEPICILEIGSYDYSDTIRARGLFSNAQIFSLEADRGNFDRFAYRAHSNRIQAFWMAASDHTGYEEFYPSLTYGRYGAWTGSGSIVKPHVVPGTNESTVYPKLAFDLDPARVPCISVDGFCERHGINHIDWLRIDAQGAEYKIIQAIQFRLPTYIWAEHVEFATYDSGVTIADFDGMLAAKGYSLVERFGNDTLYKHEHGI